MLLLDYPIIYRATPQQKNINLLPVKAFPKKKSIQELYQAKSRRARCKLLNRLNTSLDTVTNELQKAVFKNDIAILHIEGIASGNSLQYIDHQGRTQEIPFQIFAQTFAQLKGLKILLFQGPVGHNFVRDVLTAGIPCLIVAEAKNPSLMPPSIEIFYQAIFNRYTIRDAFNKAKDILQPRIGHLVSGQIGQGTPSTKHIKGQRWEEKTENGIYWEIFYLETNEIYLNWSLKRGIL